MDRKKWVAYGVSGVVGLGILAGGAVTAAQAMDLRSLDGQTIPGGSLTGKASLVSETPDATPTPTPSPSASHTGPSPVTTPTAATPPTPPTPASAPSPVTPPSPVSPVSPASPVSVVSAPSN